MDLNNRKRLNNLSFELVTKAALAIDNEDLKPTMIIPFCIMMLENSIKILNQSKEHNPEFAKNTPEDLVDLAIANVLSMFDQVFGRKIESYVESNKKNKEEISQEVNDFLKNLPKKGEDK